MKNKLTVIIACLLISGCSAPAPRPCDSKKTIESALLGFIGISVCGSKHQINPYF